MRNKVNGTDVLEILDFLDQAKIEVWLDGGWGVDALFKKQNRSHKDVDIIISLDDVEKLKIVLKEKGFKLINCGILTSFTLKDKNGREVDVHAVRFDANGNGIYRMKNGKDWIYPSAGFTGKGEINGRAVKCLTAEVQMLCHTGYKLTEKDFTEMKLLHEKFGVVYP